MLCCAEEGEDFNLNGMKDGGGYFGMSVVHFGYVLSIDLYFYVHEDGYQCLWRRGQESENCNSVVIRTCRRTSAVLFDWGMRPMIKSDRNGKDSFIFTR